MPRVPIHLSERALRGVLCRGGCGPKWDFTPVNPKLVVTCICGLHKRRCGGQNPHSPLARPPPATSGFYGFHGSGGFDGPHSWTRIARDGFDGIVKLGPSTPSKSPGAIRSRGVAREGGPPNSAKLRQTPPNSAKLFRAKLLSAKLRQTPPNLGVPGLRLRP